MTKEVYLYQHINSLEKLEDAIAWFKSAHGFYPTGVVLPPDLGDKVPPMIDGVPILVGEKGKQPPTGHAFLILGEDNGRQTEPTN